MPQHCRGTLGDCSGSQLFLSLLTFFLEVAYLCFLLTQLVLLPSWVSEKVEDYTAIVIVFLVYLMQKASYDRKKIRYKTLNSPTLLIPVATMTVCHRNHAVVVYALNSRTREEYKMGGNNSPFQSHSEVSWRKDQHFGLRLR